METFPRSLTEFESRFATEEACLAYVRAHKWPDGFRCAICQGTASWVLKVRRVEECSTCGHQESVTAGTLFHQTRKPLRLWFRAITLWVTSKRGISAKELSRQLDLHYETAWLWCHRLRAAVGAAFGKEPLSGVVEVAETSVGGTDDRAQTPRALATVPARVGGAVEVRPHRMGRVRLAWLSGPKTNNLNDFARKNVGQPDGGLLTGAEPVRHGPHVHRVFSLLKRVVFGTFHGAVSHKHFPAYLDEFQFRFNRRNAASRWLLFQRVIAAGTASAGVSMRDLTHGVRTDLSQTDTPFEELVQRNEYLNPT